MKETALVRIYLVSFSYIKYIAISSKNKSTLQVCIWLSIIYFTTYIILSETTSVVDEKKYEWYQDPIKNGRQP